MMLPLLRFFILLTLPAWPFHSGKDSGSAVPPQKSALTLPANPEAYRYIRVAIMTKADEIKVSSPAPYTVKKIDGTLLASGEKLYRVPTQATKDGIQIGKQLFREPGIVLEGGQGIRIAGVMYSHQIVLWQEPPGKLLVINNVEMETYIKSVIAWEANPQWSPEALKAQAIAARTFALFRALSSADRKYDVLGDVFGQVYKGDNTLHPKTDSVVDATRGQILTMKGKVFPAYYHSTCGGHTTSIETFWNMEPNAALRGVQCDFCRKSPHYNWRFSVPEKELEKILKKQGYRFVDIQRIVPVDLDESGRPARLRIEARQGKATVKAADFRIWLGPEEFKSTFIKSIDVAGDDVRVRGHGWGHGVGMCQFGMKYLGQIGYTYPQILQYYYPESEITTLGL